MLKHVIRAHINKQIKMSKILQTITQEEIFKLIPHRPPFLLVDEVTELNQELTKALGVKKTNEGDWFFKGHFPGNPIMPGVLIIEALAQTGGILCSYKRRYLGEDKGDTPPLTLFIAIDEVRFKKPVVPGDSLDLRVNEIYYNRHSISRYTCEAKVGNDAVASGILTAKYIVEGSK